MNAPTFKSHSVTCPICHRSSTIPPTGIYTGLFSCPHCHSNLVISWSGHFVRDPFTLNPLMVGKMLRRQSRPFARLRRDLGVAKYLSMFAILGSAVCLGWMIATADQPISKQQPIKNLIEWINGSDSPKDIPK